MRAQIQIGNLTAVSSGVSYRADPSGSQKTLSVRS
jgi:hypothetical protein